MIVDDEWVEGGGGGGCGGVGGGSGVVKQEGAYEGTACLVGTGRCVRERCEGLRGGSEGEGLRGGSECSECEGLRGGLARIDNRGCRGCYAGA